MNKLYFILVLLLLGGGAFFVLDSLEISEIVSSDEDDDDDNDDDDELEARQGLIDGKLVVRLSPETQKTAGVRTRLTEDIELEAEDYAFANVVDINTLLDLRAVFLKLQAQREVLQAVLQNADAVYRQLKVLNEEAGNISTNELQAARTKVLETRAQVNAVDTDLESTQLSMLQKWGDELTSLALKPGSELFQRLLKREEVIVLLSLSADQELSENEAFVFINRVDDRSKARKAYYLSKASSTDQVLQGETHLYRTAAEGLRTGMRLYAWLPGTGFSGTGINIPVESIIWYAGKPWAYVQEDEETFSRRSLVDPVQSNNTWLVRENFQTGEKIVVSGAQTLLSEEFKFAIPDEDDD